MKTYFLSYARADEGAALRFANDLMAGGVSVWVDQYDIRPSQHWDRAVEAAVRSCEGLIVVLSPRSVASPNVADEVSVAIDDKKDLIPILIEPCVLPLRMTRMQFIDATRDYEAALRRCLAAIAGNAPTGRPAPAAQTSSALAPEVLAAAERRLTGFIGPIARVMVRQAAGRARSEAELYGDLAGGLPTAERESFLGWLHEPRSPNRVVTPRAAPAGPPPASPEALTPQDLDSITRALTRHLGPIAPQLVSRERPNAASRADLCRRLGARIPTEKDRATFLRETGAT